MMLSGLEKHISRGATDKQKALFLYSSFNKTSKII